MKASRTIIAIVVVTVLVGSAGAIWVISRLPQMAGTRPRGPALQLSRMDDHHVDAKAQA